MGETSDQRRLTWWLVLVAAGYILLFVALGKAAEGPVEESDGSPPTCGGEPMAPGDVCRETRIGRRSSMESHSYEELRALQRSNARVGPWFTGMFIGTLGAVLVFVGLGRHLIVRGARLRHPGRWVALGAVLPLLALAAALWPLELRYDITDRNEWLLMSSFRPDVPDAPFLTLALLAVGTVFTMGAVLEARDRDARAARDTQPPGVGKPSI